MIAPCYPESVANEVLSTVGGVRFIKWAQDLVSFVKCEPPSIRRYWRPKTLDPTGQSLRYDLIYIYR